MRQTLVKHIHFHAHLRGVTWQVRDATNFPTPETTPAGPAASKPPISDEQPAPEPKHESETNLDRLEQLLEEILEGVHQLDEKQQGSLGELQRVAVELSVAIAAHLVKEKLDVGEAGIESLVEAAISRLAPCEPIVIHLNPLDEAALTALWKDRLTAVSPTLTFTVDEQLPRGACRATAGDFGLLSTLEQRLATIRDNLLQGIAYAQIERRKADTDGGSLRRFPDRRQTA